MLRIKDKGVMENGPRHAYLADLRFTYIVMTRAHGVM
jgi:hypothetical protein